MRLFTPNWRWLAIPVSAAFVYGGLRVLLGPSLSYPSTWGDYHILTILTVGATIGAGHLCGIAWRARRLACIGFLILFATGTTLVVRQSLGRQAENTGQTMLAAEDINGRIADKSADLKSAKDRLANAERQADREMTGQRCATRCKAWQQNASDLRVVIRQIEAEVAALGPQKPVNAGAEHLAEMAGFFGYQREKTITLDTLFTPLLTTLFFEIGSIISLGFAFRHSPSISKPEWQSEKLPDPSMFSWGAPEPPKPRKRKSIASNVVPIDFRVSKHPVVEALESNGGTAHSNKALARMMTVSPGEASKRTQEIPDLLSVRKIGKRVEISLKKSA